MPTGGQQNRVFLRIPVKISAEVYVNGQCCQRSRLVDLSTNGLAFFISPSDILPDEFEIRFKLSPFSRSINVMLQVRNRVSLAEGVRIGCVFLQIPDQDRKRIDQYVCTFAGISFPQQAVNVAAFLCAIDAALRILLYQLNAYYSATDFGRSVPGPGVPVSSAVMLACYAVTAFLAFILSSPSLVRRWKLSFISSLLLLGYAFFFLLMKNLDCRQEWRWGGDDLYAASFLVMQLFLVLYLGFALGTGLLFIKKIALILDVIKQEFLVLKFGFTRKSRGKNG